MFGQLELRLTICSSNRTRRLNPCIYGPKTLKNRFHHYENKDEIDTVLAKIDKIYNRLGVRKDSLDRGYCFGLLDPATNILVNRAISLMFHVDPRGGGGGGGDGARREQARDMNQRSLDGLVCFLTCIFPYLPDAEARVYLHAADMDPFVAMLLIISRRGLRRFDFFSHTTKEAVETALRCAAVAAGDPDPLRLVLAWKLLSPAVVDLHRVRSRKKHGDVILHFLRQKTVRGAFQANDAMSDQGFHLEKVLELARIRHQKAHASIFSRPKALPPARGPMKRILLATIHGLYLQALSRLPTAELCGRYHHSILMGGYCYGPLDPVSNIIVNTIWYSQNFPASKQFTVGMISTSCLWRIAARSLYGLVTFLCTRYPGLTPDLAMERLIVTKADLRAADPNFPGIAEPEQLNFHGCYQIGCCFASHNQLQHYAIHTSPQIDTISEAYAAAATAAFHPSPLAQSDFLGRRLSKLVFASKVLHPQEDGSESQNVGSGSQSGVSKPASEVLRARGRGPLSSDDHWMLCRILERCPSTDKSRPQHGVAPTKIKKSVFDHKSMCSYRFWRQHERVSSMVKDALGKYNDTMGNHLFTLHIICGVNEFVSGPVPCMGEVVGEYNPWTPHKYYHSHINFLAVCKGRLCDPPTLFFAECGKDGASTCWCVPVTPKEPDAEQVRCVYCEYKGNRIVHPGVGSFCGLDEFDKLYYLS